MEPSDRTWEELVADGAASLNRASLVPARNRPTRFSSSSSSSSGEGSSLLPPRKLQQLCTSKQAWQTAALIFIPLIFNQLGSVMSHYSDWALASPPPLHAPPGARQQLTLVTLASILERSPLFFFFFSSWWVDLAVLLALIALFRFMSSPACTAASPSPKEVRGLSRLLWHCYALHCTASALLLTHGSTCITQSGFRSRWGTVLHAFSFFSALFNLRQSSAIVGTVFMLLASTAKGRADTIERARTRPQQCLWPKQPPICLSACLIAVCLSVCPSVCLSV